jgi:hypothetical protein
LLADKSNGELIHIHFFISAPKCLDSWRPWDKTEQMISDSDILLKVIFP